MRARRRLLLALLGAGTVAATSAAPLLAQDKGGGAPPLELDLLVSDSPGRQSEAAALDFARLVGELSDDQISIVMAFEVDDGGTSVLDGSVELSIVPTRDWARHNVTSMDVFETPFLIDDDALADAVATSDAAAKAMAGLEGAGVKGLALWPEDLRHIYAFEPAGIRISAPDDLIDRTFIAPAGAPGRALVEALGARLYEDDVQDPPFTGDRDSDASAGLVAGMFGGLVGAGVPIGDRTVVASDIVPFAKFQTLVVNSEAWARLSAGQRAIIEEASNRARDAVIARRAHEAELGAAYCENGGVIFEAGVEAVQRFQAAAAPVLDAMRADPLTSELIATVEALKATTEDSPRAAPCDGASTTTASLPPVSETEGYRGTLPPNGTFRAEITEQDLLERGASAGFARSNAAVVTWTFTDGTYTFQQGTGTAPCPGTATSDGSVMRVVEEPGHPCGLGGDFLWRAEPDGISFVLPSFEGLTPVDATDLKAYFERLWTRID